MHRAQRSNLLGDHHTDLVSSPQLVKHPIRLSERLCRAIILLRKMGQGHLSEFSGDPYLEQSGRLGIGEMAMVGLDSLLEAPGIAPVQEHLEVMIEFEDGDGHLGELLLDQRSRPSQVRDHPGPAPLAADSIGDWITRIVGNGESLDIQGTQGELLPRLDELDSLRYDLRIQGCGRAGSHEEGDSTIPSPGQAIVEDSSGSHVIGVLMGDEHGIDGSVCQSQAGHPREDLLRADSAVHQNACLTIPDIGAVATGPGSQDHELQAASGERVDGDVLR
jgi:hypothetical protein